MNFNTFNETFPHLSYKLSYNSSELRKIQADIDELFLDRKSGGFSEKLQRRQANLSRLHGRLKVQDFALNSPADQANQSIAAAINDLENRWAKHNVEVNNISKASSNQACQQLFSKLDALLNSLPNLLESLKNLPELKVDVKIKSPQQKIDELILLINSCKQKSRWAARTCLATAYKTNGFAGIDEATQNLVADFNDFVDELSIIIPKNLSIEKQVELTIALTNSNLKTLKAGLDQLLDLSMDIADKIAELSELLKSTKSSESTKSTKSAKSDELTYLFTTDLCKDVCKDVWHIYMNLISEIKHTMLAFFCFLI